MSEQMNDYVLAQLNKLVVDTRVKLERVRSLQRQTPSLGTSNTRQIVLQRQVKELLSQARTWEWLLAVATHGDQVIPFTNACPTQTYEGPCAGTLRHAGDCTANADDIPSERER